MFPGMNPFNQLQPFSQGMGGVNPLVSQLMGSQSSNPLASLFGQQGGGQGWGQSVHPLAIAHIVANYPALLPLLTQQSGYGQVPYGIQSLLQSQQGQMGSPYQQWGGGVGQQGSPLTTILSLLGQQGGQQGFGQQFGGFGQQTNPLSAILSLVGQQRGQQGFGQQFGGFGQQTNPLSVILSLIGQQGFGQQTGFDPYTVAMQLSQLSQSQLPIRPLISPQQFDPFQASCLTSVVNGQAIDPYTALACVSPVSAFAVSPIHQALRPQVVSPWTVSAAISPLASQIAPIAVSPWTSQIAPIAVSPLASPVAPIAVSPLASPIAPMMQSLAQPCII